MAVIALIVIAGAAGIVALAFSRESVVGVSPEAGIDHWHDAYLVHRCGEDLPASSNTDGDNGIHTHGSGLIHTHPFNVSASGPNATLGVFFEAIGAELTDDSYTPGPGEAPIPMDEADGCNGEDAVLQVAYWSNAWTVSEPEIFTENLADVPIADESGGAYTVALLPEGAEIPMPPADRLINLEQTNGSRA